MTVKEIMTQWLKDNGYDGLFAPGECACAANDLMPCCESCEWCEPGYVQGPDPDGECDFMLGASKPKTEQTNTERERQSNEEEKA